MYFWVDPSVRAAYGAPGQLPLNLLLLSHRHQSAVAVAAVGLLTLLSRLLLPRDGLPGGEARPEAASPIGAGRKLLGGGELGACGGAGLGWLPATRMVLVDMVLVVDVVLVLVLVAVRGAQLGWQVHWWC